MKNFYGMSKRLMLFFVMAAFTNVMYGQQQEIKGQVNDAEDGMSIPGVNVTVKGITGGTITDIDGNFLISAEIGNTLIFSYIGYKTQEFKIIDGSVINIELESGDVGIEEVIVVGYGTQKKSDRTGAVYSVSSEDIQTVAIQDPIEGVMGKIAGVTIRKSGSDPNGGFNVRIRGASGLNSGTDPLYVVDGVVGVDATTIAPEDIKSFNVLKDASSTAIYGSRGSNGVIIITTKKGIEGKTQVEVSSYVSLAEVSTKSRLDLMSADEFRAYGNKLGIEVRDLGASTDWQDEIYRQGFSHNETVAFSGGNKTGNYRASISNNTMEGVIKNSAKKRLIARLNAQTKAFNDKLLLSMNLAHTSEHNDYINYGSSGADGVLFQAFQRNPTLPVYNEDGTYYQDPTQPVNNYSNPVAILNDIQNERDAKRLLANLRADFDIIKGLKLSVNGAYTRDDEEKYYFEPASNGPLNGEGKGEREYKNHSSMLFESFLNYNKDFGSHNIDLTAGYSYQNFGWDGFKASGKDPGSDYTGANDLAALATVNPGDIDSWKGESLLISSFGRVVYNFNRKYFLTATVRRDGSSKFGANYEWGLFPSASLAWNVKRESFLESSDIISQAKLRAGYGQTGNQEIDAYKNIALFGITGYTLDPTSNQYTVNYGAIQNPNPNLKWEVNTEMNVGIDFGFFNDRITGSFDYYDKKTTDLIYTYTVPVPPNLVNTTLANAGAIDIKGFEVVVLGHIINSNFLKWTSTIVASHNKAVVAELGNVDFPPVEKVPEGYLQEPLGYGTFTQILKEGYERGTFYGPKFVGIDQNTGSFLYERADGTYTTIDNITDEDKQVLGTAQPKLELGWTNSFTIANNFDLNFTFRGMFGHDVLNATNMVFDNPSYFPTRNVLNSAPERTELTGSSDFSDYFLEKGNFVRLENITLGYTFKTSNIDWLSKARVFVSGNNLFTITKYSGIDPSPIGVGLNDRTIGIDIFNVYPKSATITFGFNMVF